MTWVLLTLSVVAVAQMLLATSEIEIEITKSQPPEETWIRFSRDSLFMGRVWGAKRHLSSIYNQFHIK